MTDNDPATTSPLVRGLFAIDAIEPDDVFEGWHDPNLRWNRSPIPAFDRANTLKIIAWTARKEGPSADPRTTFRWDGPDLVMTETYDDGEQNEQRLSPDTHGRYWIGARTWVWNEIKVPDGESLSAWLQRTNENTYVYVAATQIANTWAIDAHIGWPARQNPAERIGEDAIAQLSELHPADASQPLSDETTLLLRPGPQANRAPLRWNDLTPDERAALLDLAVTRATHPAALQQAFQPTSAVWVIAGQELVEFFRELAIAGEFSELHMIIDGGARVCAPGHPWSRPYGLVRGVT